MTHAEKLEIQEQNMRTRLAQTRVALGALQGRMIAGGTTGQRERARMIQSEIARMTEELNRLEEQNTIEMIHRMAGPPALPRTAPTGWCKCGTPEDGRYWQHDEHDCGIRSQHIHCMACGELTQVG